MKALTLAASFAFAYLIATALSVAGTPGIREVSLPTCTSFPFRCLVNQKCSNECVALLHIAERVSLQWDIGPLGDAKMFVENTDHYALDTEEGIAEWASLVPPDGGVIKIPGHENQPLTISLFHQLRCLDVLRGAVVSSLQNRTAADPKTIHCLNYLRQMVLCRAD